MFRSGFNPSNQWPSDRFLSVLKKTFLPLRVLIILLGGLPYASYCDKGVLGTDDRVLVEFDSFKTDGSQFLGALSISNKVVCSAVLVGPSHIATAAHCLRDASEMTHVRFHLHLQDGASKITSQVIQWETLPFLQNHRTEHDWAVLKLSKPLGLFYGWVEPSTEKIPVGTRLRSFGYPGDLVSETGASRAVYVPECSVLEQGGTIPEAGRMDCDIFYGSSGGPVLAEMPSENRSKKQYYLAGLNVRLDLTDSGFNEFTEGSTFYKSWVGAVVQASLQDVLTRILETHKPQNTPKEFLGVLIWAEEILNEVKDTEIDVADFEEAQLAVEMFRLFTIVDEIFVTESISARSGAEFADGFEPLIVERVKAGSFAEKAGLVHGDQLIRILNSVGLDDTPLNKMGLRLAQFIVQGKPLDIEVYNRLTKTSRVVSLGANILSAEEMEVELIGPKQRFQTQFEKLRKLADRVSKKYAD